MLTHQATPFDSRPAVGQRTKMSFTETFHPAQKPGSSGPMTFHPFKKLPGTPEPPGNAHFCAGLQTRHDPSGTDIFTIWLVEKGSMHGIFIPVPDRSCLPPGCCFPDISLPLCVLFRRGTAYGTCDWSKAWRSQP